MKRLTIFAMTRKGLEVVASIAALNAELVAEVVCARDSQIQEDHYDDLAALCRTHDIPFRDRHEFTGLTTDYALAVSWRWLIEPGRAQLIVLHDSLLPAYRGFNPLVTALINGDKKIGVTALYATGDYDRGEIIAQAFVRIAHPIRLADAIDALVDSYKAVAVRIAEQLAQDVHPPSRAQDEALASYSLWRDEEDYQIDWSGPAPVIRRFIDAVGYPYKGAMTRVDDGIHRVLSAQELPDVAIANRTPGKVIFVVDQRPVVVCGEGLLRIDELVDESGRSALPLRRFRTRFK